MILARRVGPAALVAGILGTLIPVLAQPAFATASPSWEPDSNALGTLTFYDSTGAVITGGSNVNDIAKYVVASTAGTPGATKATLYFALPAPNNPNDVNKPATGSWSTASASAASPYPNASAPAPVSSTNNPVVTIDGSTGDGDLRSFVVTHPHPAGDPAAYQGVYQVRVKDSGPGGVGSDSKYWDADVQVTFDGNGNPSSWTELYPTNVSDTTAPTVTSIGTPATLTAPAVVTFSESVSGLSIGAVRIVVTGTSSAVAVATSCLSGSTPVACGGTYNRIRLTPVTSLTPGQHYTVAVGSAATHDLAGNPSTASSKAFRALTTVEENNGVVAKAWPLVHAKPAFGHSFAREHLAGASASWTFTGTSITWWTITGPDQGKAKLFVDGVRKLTVSNYAAKQHFAIGRTVKGLHAGRHTVRVLVLGLKGSKVGKGTFVAVDAFSAGKTRTANPSLAAAWRSINNSHLYAGHAIVADLATETVTLRFRGTGIALATMRGLTQGKANVFVDGVRKLTINDFAKHTAFHVRHAIRGLSDKLHTLKIVVVGSHTITIDRFTVS